MPPSAQSRGRCSLTFEPPSGTCEVPFLAACDAIGGHPTQTIVCAVYPRSHRAPAPICARATRDDQRGGQPIKLPRRKFLHLAACAAALPAVSRFACAQAYPARPVRLLVGWPPGGAADVVGRLTGQLLSERLGQQFVIENRPGAGGNLAVEAALKAAPDGYTLLMIGSNNAWNVTLYDNLSFDFVRDIAPVASIVRGVGVLVVHPSVSAKSVPDLIAYAKANPGKINMASGGVGSPQHVYGELFKMMTGVDMLHVPYRGGAPALTDLLAGQVQVMFDTLITSIEHIRAGKLRPLAVTPQRGWRSCQTFRLWANSCRATRRSVGKGSVLPRPRPLRSSTSSTRRSMRVSLIPASRRESPTSVTRCLQARLPTSADSSPHIPRSGPR